MSAPRPPGPDRDVRASAWTNCVGQKAGRQARKRPKGFGDEPTKYHSDAIFLIGISAATAMTVFDPRPDVDEVWPGTGVIYARRRSSDARTGETAGSVMGPDDLTRYPSPMANVIDYVELAVGDVEQAKAFYSTALGWSFNDYGPDYAGIQDPTRPGEEFGGLKPAPVATRGEGVLALARTDDVEAALASVLEAGGRIVVELHEYPGGRRFTFADPWGNILGVYQPLG